MELWVVLLGAIVVGYVLGSDGCFQEEKGALLDLKGNESLLASWVDDPKSNCCAWERVTCDSSSGHVIHLALGDLYIGEKEADPHISINTTMGPYVKYKKMGQYCLNPTRHLNWSLFLPFRELRSLDLSSNCFVGFIRKRV
uniref:Leucine-rich repeat-containing N-terminal plant-type domain-containing protein n=1 Tax=Cajanus cajan TaxID=3821 RepID=A0A151RJH9_CAJCA|nr:hypothetical protein KK1_035898 [Cajanus cajan]